MPQFHILHNAAAAKADQSRPAQIRLVPKTIKSKLILLVSALSLVAGLLAGQQAIDAWRKAVAADRATTADTATGNLLAAAAAWAVERGTANGLLAHPATADAAERAALSAARQRGDAAFERALAASHALGDKAVNVLSQRVEGLHQQVAAQRALIDQALQNRTDVPPELRTAWFPTTTAMIIAAGRDLSAAVETSASDAAPAVLRGFSLTRALWEASEYAGQERGMINGIIGADRAFSPLDERELGALQGHIAAAWTTVDAKLAGFAPQLGSLIAQGQQAQLHGAQEALRQRIVTAGEALAVTGKRYPVSREQWFQAATAAIAPTLAAQHAASAAVMKLAHQEHEIRLGDLVLSLAVLIAVLGIGILGISFTVRRVGHPLALMATEMERLAGGDMEVAIQGDERQDEMGALARALRDFRDALAERARLATEMQHAADAKVSHAAGLEELARSFELEAAQALRGVAAASTELDATAAEMRITAQDGTKRATSLAAATEQASANVATVASSTDEVARSIGEVARRITESAGLARQVAETARATDASMEGLTAAASRIGEVMALIGGIAAQTNLLALNATIEAARAGEAGMGFAVVASEVKTLAQQTARATKEIGAQISAIQSETSHAVAAIQGIAENVDGVDQLIAELAAAAEQQAAAISEIGRAASDAALGTRTVTRHALGVTDGAEQTGQAAAQVCAASRELAQNAELLRAQVDAFLQGIRAA